MNKTILIALAIALVPLATMNAGAAGLPNQNSACEGSAPTTTTCGAGPFTRFNPVRSAITACAVPTEYIGTVYSTMFYNGGASYVVQSCSRSAAAAETVGIIVCSGQYEAATNSIKCDAPPALGATYSLSCESYGYFAVNPLAHDAITGRTTYGMATPATPGGSGAYACSIWH